MIEIQICCTSVKTSEACLEKRLHCKKHIFYSKERFLCKCLMFGVLFFSVQPSCLMCKALMQGYTTTQNCRIKCKYILYLCVCDQSIWHTNNTEKKTKSMLHANRMKVIFLHNNNEQQTNEHLNIIAAALIYLLQMKMFPCIQSITNYINTQTKEG